MRKDHDYVEFKDYEQDMGELSEQAAHIIREQRREIDELKLQAHRLIAAAGEIRMNKHDMLDYERMEIEMFEDVSVNAIVYRVVTQNKGD